MSDLFSILEDLSNQLPGCKMASIVDLRTGMQLASVAVLEQTQTLGADAFQSELFGRIGGLNQVMGLTDGPRSVVIESEQTTFVSELIGESGYFWHIATEATTTLGFTQAIMRKFRARITQSVAHLIGA